MDKENTPLQARARIGAVLQRSTPAFQNLVGKKLDKFLVTIDKEIKNHLHKVGETVVTAIQDLISLSSPAGRNYTYVDTDGNVVDEHKASKLLQPPAMFMGDLLKSITFKVNLGDQSVVVGVFNPGVGEQYGTIAYYKKYYMKLDGKYQFVPDVVIVDDSGMKTPIKEYARKLEEEQDRPFLRNTFENILLEKKDELRQNLRDKLSELFKGKKPPVFFRIYTK